MHRIILFGIVSLVLFSCGGQKESAKKDLLLGKWQVAVVERGPDVIGGRGFQGTIFEFKPDSTVFAYNRMDTSKVRYERLGQTLVYKYDQAEEKYRIDSLSESTLKIFSDADGIPTTTTMVRVKE